MYEFTTEEERAIRAVMGADRSITGGKMLGKLMKIPNFAAQHRHDQEDVRESLDYIRKDLDRL